VISPETDLPRGTEIILVVDDEDLMRTLVCRLLSQWGYRVRSAAASSQALDVCCGITDRIDLLLTDVMLEEINGPQLAARLQRDLAPSPLRCLFMSGYPQEWLVEQGVLTRDDDFVHKPFTPSTLAHRIRASLDPVKACETPDVAA
jgi:CheY-like chemotaxis protein